MQNTKTTKKFNHKNNLYNVKKNYNIFSTHTSHKILGKVLKQTIFVKIIQYMEVHTHNYTINYENFILISKFTFNTFKTKVD